MRVLSSNLMALPRAVLTCEDHSDYRLCREIKPEK